MAYDLSYDIPVKVVVIMRINARLNDEWEEKLHFISQQRQIKKTDIIKKALDLLYEQVKSESTASSSVLMKSGFIGGGQGPENLSENYKKHLLESIHGKYDNH